MIEAALAVSLLNLDFRISAPSLRFAPLAVLSPLVGGATAARNAVTRAAALALLQRATDSLAAAAAEAALVLRIIKACSQ